MESIFAKTKGLLFLLAMLSLLVCEKQTPLFINRMISKNLMRSVMLLGKIGEENAFNTPATVKESNILQQINRFKVMNRTLNLYPMGKILFPTPFKCIRNISACIPYS